MRSGEFVRQPKGYRAFIPKPLPPEPPLKIDEEMLDLLSRAHLALGRLDGAAVTLPNPDLFVSMYVRQESVLSSQIEGTQASLVDVLEYQADAAARGLAGDVSEVVNHIDAMNYGLERLAELPVSLRLIQEIHRRLLAGVRGANRNPGEFRRDQNWIGGTNAKIETASFVPPPPTEMLQALYDLETYLNTPSTLPTLLKCGLVHAQFETIHPFGDGNGRIGRLLITFLLVEQDIIKRPLLYLSLFFKQYRDEYYERLQSVRLDGDWENWMKFFLRGVVEVATQASETARSILSLREEHRRLLNEHFRGSVHGPRLLDLLFQTPIITVPLAQGMLGVSYPTANKLVEQFVHAGILGQIGGDQWKRRFIYFDYVNLFEKLDRVDSAAGRDAADRTLPEST
jgi:Fic family protein